MRKSLLTVAAAGLMVLTLTGCGNAKIIGKSLPDETQVVDGPNLVLPPQFELRPPRDAKDAPSYEERLSAQKGEEAKSLITGTSATVAAVSSASATVPAVDSWIVDQAAKQGHVTVDPNVRAELEVQHTEEKAKEEKSLWQKWFGNKDE